MIVSEDDKDELIAAFGETRTVLESPTPISAIPMNVQIDHILFEVIASHNVPSGAVVETYE